MYLNTFLLRNFPHLYVSVLLLTIAISFKPCHSQQQYPSTLMIPVTFYDFHSDSSNPEFEINPKEDAVKRNMVAAVLDSEKKPQVGTSPFFNRMISRWFRPWVKGESANNQLYNYYGEYDGNRFDRYKDFPKGSTTVPFDTSFKNIVIHDTLEFRYVSGSKGMYEYVSENFFPLDNVGFGKEGREHNFSFTMEMHWTFTMVPGLTFSFTGDDDVWAYINNKQVMDLGGIHNPSSGTFNVDDLPNMTPNQKFSFDLFYAERHVYGSSIRITTNIIAPPSVLQLYDNANPPGAENRPISSLDNVSLDKPLTVYGHVFDTTGVWKKEYDAFITWRKEGSDKITLSSTSGASTTITGDASLAGKEVVLIAVFKNPDDPSLAMVEVRLPVKFADKKTTDPVNPVKPADPQNPGDPDNPGEPTDSLPVEDHLDIVIDSSTARSKEKQLKVYSFLPEKTEVQLYAVVRDRDGNFIRFATEAQWQSLDKSVVNVAPKSGISTMVRKSGAELGSQTKIVVTAPNLGNDTLQIVLKADERTGVVPNPFVPGKVSIKTILPSDVLMNYSVAIAEAKTDYVTLVVIEAPQPLRVIGSARSGIPSFASVKIYDVVGNLIRDDLSLVEGIQKMTYAVAWDGTNRNGRIVGCGTYLMTIDGALLTGKKYRKTHKIGIANKPRS